MKVALQAIEYDENTKKLLSDVQKADALSGARGNSFMQQSMARGFEAAGQSDAGAMGMAFMGMGANAVGGVAGNMQQPANVGVQGGMAGQGQSMSNSQQNNEDPMEKLTKAKQMLDAGLITQEDYDNIKKQALGL